jgi:hypothetical protein
MQGFGSAQIDLEPIMPTKCFAGLAPENHDPFYSDGYWTGTIKNKNVPRRSAEQDDPRPPRPQMEMRGGERDALATLLDTALVPQRRNWLAGAAGFETRHQAICIPLASVL